MVKAEYVNRVAVKRGQGFNLSGTEDFQETLSEGSWERVRLRWSFQCVL